MYRCFKKNTEEGNEQRNSRKGGRDEATDVVLVYGFTVLTEAEGLYKAQNHSLGAVSSLYSESFI